MRQDIIDGIIAGEQLQAIAARLQPKLHLSTITRYRMRLLGKASKSLRRQNVTASALKDLCDADPSRSGPTEQIRSALQASIEKAAERREKWILAAETASDGPNHTALSSYDRNNLSSLEFQAKLHGLLQTANSAQTAVNIQLVVMPREDSTGQTIDITPGE